MAIDRERKMSYLLGEGIYPDWPIIIKLITHSANVDACRFSKNQEAARKDVERLFRVVKERFQILGR